MKILLRLILLIVFIWTCLSIYFIGDGKIASGDNTIVTLVNSLVFLIEIITVLVIISNTKLIVNNLAIRILLVWLLFLILNIFLTSENVFADFRSIFWWSCGFILCYSIFLSVNINKILQIFKIWILVSISSVALLFFFLKFGSLNVSLLLLGNSASNEIFYLVTLSPFLFFLKRKSLKYFFFAVIMIATIISLKRSAFIILFLVMMFSLYYDYIINSKGRFLSRIFVIVSLALGSVLIFNYFNEQMENSLLGRISSIQEDKGSGRLDIYEIVFDKYLSSPIERKFMGAGHDGVRRSEIVWETRGDVNPYISAHNDFVELLYDYGIFGLLIYLAFIFQIIKNTIKLRKISTTLYSANFSSLIIFFIMSMVSHLVIYPTYFFFLSMLWGLSAAIINKSVKKTITFYEN